MNRIINNVVEGYQCDNISSLQSRKQGHFLLLVYYPHLLFVFPVVVLYSQVCQVSGAGLQGLSLLAMSQWAETTAPWCHIIIGFNPGFKSLVYAGPIFGHHCACRFPGTKWSQVISRHSDEYRVTHDFKNTINFNVLNDQAPTIE